MKRTSVVYNPSPSYSYNAESTRASQNIRRNSLVVLTVGIILIGLIAFFILKNAGAAGLLAAAIVPGNPFDDGQRDDDTWRLVLGIIGVIVLLVGLPLSFIL